MKTANEIRKLAKIAFDKLFKGVYEWSIFKTAFDLGYAEGIKDKESYAEQVAKEHAIKFAEYNYQMPKYINFFPENILTTEEVYNKWINNKI